MVKGKVQALQSQLDFCFHIFMFYHLKSGTPKNVKMSATVS